MPNAAASDSDRATALETIPSHDPTCYGRPMRLVAAVAAALLTVGCTTPAAEAPAPVSAQSEAPIAEPLRARLQARLDNHRTDHGYPGAIAGVWTPDGTWIGKTGLAGRDSDRPPARSDHTRIGSVTKTFTVTWPG
jgi:D-alanyl-D-alanine carboxypeptidase